MSGSQSRLEFAFTLSVFCFFFFFYLSIFTLFFIQIKTCNKKRKHILLYQSNLTHELSIMILIICYFSFIVLYFIIIFTVYGWKMGENKWPVAGRWELHRDCEVWGRVGGERVKEELFGHPTRELYNTIVSRQSLSTRVPNPVWPVYICRRDIRFSRDRTFGFSKNTYAYTYMYIHSYIHWELGENHTYG